ncbi:glycine-rich protein family [Actinidia rufa]|uniref:Glycine-rich protein family n=1 Tax=Actinidia rufa TaxID=165716 RepID=A0A7J0F5F0_9ERIC|nr:glycine-rich protein family [Actinidia rufa]
MCFGILLLVVLVLSPCLVCGINGGEAKDGIAQSDTAISSRKLSHGLGIGVGEIQGRNTTSSGEVVVSSKAGKNGKAGGGGGGGSGRDGGVGAVAVGKEEIKGMEEDMAKEVVEAEVVGVDELGEAMDGEGEVEAVEAEAEAAGVGVGWGGGGGGEEEEEEGEVVKAKDGVGVEEEEEEEATRAVVVGSGDVVSQETPKGGRSH